MDVEVVCQIVQQTKQTGVRDKPSCKRQKAALHRLHVILKIHKTETSKHQKKQKTKSL